jgi:predicted RNA-binding protein
MREQSSESRSRAAASDTVTMANIEMCSSALGNMEKITTCKKTDTGVSMVWMEGKLGKEEFFSFTELEEMRINADELILHPNLYRIDLQEHKIYVSQQGRNTN